MARLAHCIGAGRGELRPALIAFVSFCCLFTGYFMLRPVRESMGIAGGVEHLQWLFTANLIGTLAVVPAYAWVAARLPRTQLAVGVHGFFCVNLLLFAGLFQMAGEDVRVARAFYVWLSIYNLMVVSVTWSLMTDVFDARQARRLFGFLAAGASVGGLLGPAASVVLAGALGEAGLVLLAAALLGVALACNTTLLRWRAKVRGTDISGACRDDDARAPIGGNALAGFTEILTSRYLLAVAGFVLLLAATTTLLYIEQMRLVAEWFPDRTAQIRVFGLFDVAVQAGALLLQLFVTGRAIGTLGLGAWLAIVPMLVCVGFVALASSPGFAMLAVLVVIRRIGEYAFIRPGRELLFASLDVRTRYRAKTVIDTAVYRAGDAASAWCRSIVDLLGQGTALVAVIGAVCALVWAALGWSVGRHADRLSLPARREAGDRHGPRPSRFSNTRHPGKPGCRGGAVRRGGQLVTRLTP